jgi:hypothetical protein
MENNNLLKEQDKEEIKIIEEEEDNNNNQILEEDLKINFKKDVLKIKIDKREIIEEITRIMIVN